MFTRVRNQFKDAKFARMSSGTYCIIRDLGLVKGHSFLLLFDYGAKHRFQLKVASTSGSLDALVRYPRVIATEGEAPEQ